MTKATQMPKWPWRVVKYVLFYLDSSYHLDTVFFKKNISLLLDKTKGLSAKGNRQRNVLFSSSGT